MNDIVSTTRENEALRERFSRLSAAVLRINASLDVATVLQEVVDSARALTGARYGIIATVDDAGEVHDFVASGFTPEEQNQLTQWPDGPRLFERLRDIPGTLRLEDLEDCLPSLGFSPDLMPLSPLQAVPLSHRERHVGNFFLAGKEGGGAFTDEDEELLSLFASQAAATIANARTHRDEQRARAKLEALVDTSPVGVAVFDAGTGRPVSFNREARRIVELLRTPGRPFEQVLEVITCRYSDGREVSLEEFPLAQQLGSATTMRAEEMVLSVPDGRSVKTLINVTPIHGEDGAVESVVVTIQDLAPFEELDRLRAEFVGMVSHELRAPLTSIKGSTATVLGSQPVPPAAEMLQYFRIIDGQADHMRGLIADLLDAGSIEAGTLSVAPEPSDVSRLVDRARGTFVSGGGRHRMLIDLPPDLPPVMADRERIVQVLNNLFSNASRHAPESSPSGSKRCATACMSRSRSPTGGAASRPRDSRPCSAGTPASPAAKAGAVSREPGWGSPSARGWSRRMAAASGRRARVRDRGRGSPSPSRWPPTPPPVRRPAMLRPARASPPTAARRYASSRWTTIRRRCAISATRCRRRATPRW